MPRLYAYDANEFTQKNLLEVFCHCYDNPYCLNIFQCAPRAIKYVSMSPPQAHPCLRELKKRSHSLVY